MSNKARDQKPTRPNAHLEERLEAVRNGKGNLLKPKKPKAKAEPTPAPAPPAQEEPKTAPRPQGAHPNAYGLRVADGSLGLHAGAGSILVVEPVMPIKAGLAVFYLKGRPAPLIFDLTRKYQPEMARPFAPGSEALPLIEVIAPETGIFG